MKKAYWQKIPYIGAILFVLGFMGGLSLRLTIFLEPLGQNWVKFVWYLGVISYIIFYSVRYSIEKHRRRLAFDYKLIERLNNNKLSSKDIQRLDELLASQRRSKVMFNYIFWFILSVVSFLSALIFVK